MPAAGRDGATLGLTLPPLAEPSGNYRNSKQVGELLFLSGKGPRAADGKISIGQLGADVSVEQGYADARLAGLFLLSAARLALGTLSKVRGVVKLLGMVHSAPGFSQHPAVIDGCSDLFLQVLGDDGAHDRSAVGMASLPYGMTVEIEAIFHVDPK